MAISSGLALKTVGGLAAATAVGGGTYWLITNSDEVKRNEITRYDQALITWMEKVGNDIVFDIKKGAAGTDDLDAFPDFSTNPIKIVAKVTSNSTNIKGDKKEELKKLNKENNEGSDWTWTCEMNFTKDSGSNGVNDVKEEQKDKVFKSTNEGLFGKLKKDISTTDDVSIRSLKKDFIKKCAIAREKTQNKEINDKKTNTEITTPKEKISFELIKGGTNKAWGTDEGKLFFKEPKDFDYWFSKA